MFKKFSASGNIDAMDVGEVHQLGNSDRFYVDDRLVQGDVSGDIDGSFSLEFDGLLKLDDQSGPLWGLIKFYDDDDNLIYSARMFAKSQGTVKSFEEGVGGVMELEVDGKLKFLDNAKGLANIDGSFEVALDEHGQISDVINSDVTLDGWLFA